jgi:rare lipoprotein A
MKVFLFSALCVFVVSGCGVNPPAATPPASSKPPVQSKPVNTAKPGGYYLDDGPPAQPPPNLDAVPDAVPRAEPLHRFANRTYVALGNTYTPQTVRPSQAEEGLASWYGRRFHGKKTASGELYDMYAMTAAHPTLPIPSYARVTALNNGKSVVVRINDRGPFHSNRVIDLSYTAAHKLGYVGLGSTRVRVESLDPATYDIQGEALTGGLYLQLGAFSREENARALLDRVRGALELTGDQMRLVLSGALHRVQIGPYPSDEAAQTDRARVRERLDLNAVLVRRD